MILIIDNYDSFTYNLYQYLGELGVCSLVKRNDEISVDEIKDLEPEKILISPGPRTPKEAGIAPEVIEKLGPTIPILGVCLGHQCIGYAYGGSVGFAGEILHGKLSDIYHNGEGLFFNIAMPFKAIRYHSLIVNEFNLPECLTVTAWTNNGLIMGLKHKTLDVQGIQFHPESIMTQEGKQILKNWVDS